MLRATIEVGLCRERASLLDVMTALSPDTLGRGLTRSEADPSSLWSPLDHLAHLAEFERYVAAVIRRHLAGDPRAFDLAFTEDGTPLPREGLLARAHAMNEAMIAAHRGESVSRRLALTQVARAETLALLASLEDDRFMQRIPGSPFGDGSLGALLSVLGVHDQVHRRWIEEAVAGAQAVSA